MKTRRVGSLTCGALLIIFGVLFMAGHFNRTGRRNAVVLSQ